MFNFNFHFPYYYFRKKRKKKKKIKRKRKLKLLFISKKKNFFLKKLIKNSSYIDFTKFKIFKNIFKKKKDKFYLIFLPTNNTNSRYFFNYNKDIKKKK